MKKLIGLGVTAASEINDRDMGELQAQFQGRALGGKIWTSGAALHKFAFQTPVDWEPICRTIASDNGVEIEVIESQDKFFTEAALEQS